MQSSPLRIVEIGSISATLSALPPLPEKNCSGEKAVSQITHWVITSPSLNKEYCIVLSPEQQLIIEPKGKTDKLTLHHIIPLTIFHIRQFFNLKHTIHIFSSKGFLVIFLQIRLIYCYTAKFFHGKYYKFLIGNHRKAEIL